MYIGTYTNLLKWILIGKHIDSLLYFYKIKKYNIDKNLLFSIKFIISISINKSYKLIKFDLGT